MLTLRDVDFTYGRFQRRHVFRGLNWEVPTGGRTVLLGPNGAGKSTLLKLMSGAVSPQQGVVQIDSETGRFDLRSRVALMGQDILPIRGLTTLDQVRYAAWLSGHSLPTASKRARAALKHVLLEEKAMQRVNELSGGQLRRVGLAEILASDAEVLLLDEPTAGLDPAQRANFRHLLNNLPERTIVVSTHDIRDLEDDFDHITVLADGHIRFDGTPQEFHALGAQLGLSRASAEAVFSEIVAGGLH